MSPIYAARIARNKAEAEWRSVDRDQNSTTEQRIKARKAYEEVKAAYRASFKLARAV